MLSVMSKDNILLSIIVPVYNSEKYLKECLNSIVSDNHLIEIILVDDGSTDQSATICDEYAKKVDNIRVFHLTNKGVSAARNFGIKHSNGQWIWFIDSDDFIAINAIKVIIKNIKLYNPDVMIFKYDNVSENHLYGSKKRGHLINKKEAINSLILPEYATFPWNKIFRKTILIQYKIYFPENMILCEDMEFCSKAYDNAYNFFLLPSVLYSYRQNDDSVSFNKKRKHYKDAATANYDFYNYLAIKYPEFKSKVFKNTVIAIIAYLHRYHEDDNKYAILAGFIKKISKKEITNLNKRYQIEVLTFKYSKFLFRIIGSLKKVKMKFIS